MHKKTRISEIRAFYFLSLHTRFDTRNRFGFGGTAFESTEPLVILSH